MQKIEVNLYRYNPEKDRFPYMMSYSLDKPKKDIMVLDLLNMLKEEDESISYRRSCREGVCGSDGMNINGKNGLACITPISSVIKKNSIEVIGDNGKQEIAARNIIIATGSSEMKFLAHQTACPKPRGFCCLTKKTEPGLNKFF